MSYRRKEASLTSRVFVNCFALTIPVSGVRPLLRRGDFRSANQLLESFQTFQKFLYEQMSLMISK